MRQILFLCVGVAILSGLTGCGHLPRPDGHLFHSPAAQTSNFPDPDLTPQPQAPVEEKPIMRVIQGAQLSSEQADAQLIAEEEPASLGMKTIIERLSLRDAPLGEVAYLLTQLCGHNIIATNTAAQRLVSIDLRGTPLRQSLEAICRLNGLWYREDTQIVTLMTKEEYAEEMVVRRNEKMRSYTLRYTNANDIARIIESLMDGQVVFTDIGEEEVYGHISEDKEASSGGGTSTTITEEPAAEDKVRSQMLAGGGQGVADALEMARRLEKKVPAVITVFKRNNCVLARSLDEAVLDEIAHIIEDLDTPTDQVLLEMTILQITLTDGFESFFNIDFEGNDNISINTLGTSAGLAENTLSTVFGNHNISARLQLLASENRINVLATPYLMTANNSKVEFFVGEETPLRDDVSSTTLYDDEGNATTTLYDIEVTKEELGTDIEISSFINADGTITMDFSAEISTANLGVTEITVSDENTGSVQTFPLDGVNRNELTSVITAAPGEPLAIGGIIREQIEEGESKVPLLGDLPGLGFFFKQIEDTRTKTETVIILTPHLIRHPRDGWETSREFLERRSSHPRLTRQQENLLDYETASGSDTAR